MNNIKYLDGVDSKLPGLYRVVNQHNLKFYLGSTGDNRGIHRRLQKHLRRLRQNKHENSHLQRAWNKYKEKSFEFIGFMNTNKEENFDVEQYLLDTLKPYDEKIGYNLMTNVNKIRYIGDKTNHNKKNVWCKSWELLDPKNNIIKITNLAEFCRKNSFNYLSFKSLSRGEAKSIHGWRIYKGEIPKEKPYLRNPETSYDLVDINGIRFQGKNYKDFCKEKDLKRHGIYFLIKGIEKSFYGYTRYEDYQNGYRVKHKKYLKI